jgi:geranylgeranyl diphosphate synthase type II
MSRSPTPNLPDAANILRRHSTALVQPLENAINRSSEIPPRLKESIAYSITAGGKRLRPALVLESAVACGARPDDPTALAAAVAIELIHTFSLVHDDLPAMDDDDLRRGQPTNHKVFGQALAILAGDAMTTLAFETLATDARPELVPLLVKELAHAAGPAGMIGGQVLDIEGEHQQLTLDQLQKIHRLKTGALLTAACRLGAIAATSAAPRLTALTTYGTHLGLAFQITDDILDVTATPQQLGKATNKDHASGKNTYPQLLGLDASRTQAQSQIASALAALSPFDSAADGLRAIARFVIARQT